LCGFPALNLMPAWRDQWLSSQQGRLIMFKPITAITIAAAIAAVFAVLTTSDGNLAAGPLAKPDEAALKACVQRPWPYLNCVGTRVGNPNIRLVTTDRLNN
jgi:hypothetical protein